MNFPCNKQITFHLHAPAINLRPGIITGKYIFISCVFRENFLFGILHNDGKYSSQKGTNCKVSFIYSGWLNLSIFSKVMHVSYLLKSIIPFFLNLIK